MAKWTVRVSRFDGSDTQEKTFNDYMDALAHFNTVEQVEDRENAVGRVRVISENGNVMKAGLVG